MNSPTDVQPYIQCEDLFKIYKTEELEVVALRGLDLRVSRGEMMAIVGASGSGKSTLLNILSGLDQPSAGRVTVGPRDLLTMTDDDLVEYRRTEVGFIWQQTSRNLIPYLNARQNVAVPMMLEGRARNEAGDRADFLLEEIGIIDKREQHPVELSGGEQQRVAIGVALANNPPLLLADEPTGELDTSTADEVFQAFRRLNESTGVTILIVSHDRGITSRVDRVVAMRDGRTSSEIVRYVQFSQGKGEFTEEFSVVDRSGRLQIPHEYLKQLGIDRRARVNINNDHVEVRPEQPASKKQPRWKQS